MAFGQIQAAGKLAAQTGKPHSANPHPKYSAEELVWFETWYLATVEREVGRKILPGLPDSSTGLLMYNHDLHL